jgi:MbtH protein
MTHQELKETRQYQAVVNHEGQYSIWFVDRDLPLGWNYAGKMGTKLECLDFINEVWTDMRPLTLRKQMEACEVAAADAD